MELVRKVSGVLISKEMAVFRVCSPFASHSVNFQSKALPSSSVDKPARSWRASPLVRTPDCIKRNAGFPPPVRPRRPYDDDDDDDLE